MQTESAPGCVSNNVFGQPQGDWARRSSSPRKPDDETIAGAEHGAVSEVNGMQIRWNRDKVIEVLIGENVMESRVDGGLLAEKSSGLSLTKSQ